MIPRIAITTGEPAGIGPDICLELSSRDWPVELVLLGNRSLLEQRAELLNLKIDLVPFEKDSPKCTTIGRIAVLDLPLLSNVEPGTLNPMNAVHVVEMLKQAGEGCLGNTFSAIVTAPVQKSVINDAGLPFSGHTEFFAELCGAKRVVMMLASKELRVALATTHLPLREVADAINEELLIEIITTLNHDLKMKFGIQHPRIQVCGLNPHAGEDGHLGKEEQEIISPTLEKLRQQGINLTGPVAADTAFNQDRLENFDAVLAMYHDQGLPTLKHQAFGDAINITLGLPIIRTSVDHGTALDMAGTGQASASSLFTATELAIAMVSNQQPETAH